MKSSRVVLSGWPGLVLGLLAAVTIAAWLRLPFAGHPLWLDELITAWVVRDDVHGVLGRWPISNVPPLYYLLEWASTAVVGYDELGLRLPSLVAGLLLPIAVGLLVRRLTGGVVFAVLAALLVATDEVSARAALEVRPYAMVELVAVWQVHALIVLLEQPRRRTVLLFGLLTALLLHLHVTAGLLPLAELVLVALLVLRGGERRHLLAMFVGLLVAAVLALPLVGEVRYLLGARATLGSFVRDNTVEHAISRFGSLHYVVLPIACASLLAAAGPRPAEIGRDRRLLLLGCWLLVPSLGVWLLGSVGAVRLDVDRYVMVAAAAPIVLGIVLLARGFAGLPRWLGVGVLVAVSQLGGPGLTGEALTGALPRALKAEPTFDWREAVARANQVPAQLPVFVDPAQVESAWLHDDLPPARRALLHDYLLAAVTTLYPLHGPRVVVPVHAIEDLAEQRSAIASAGGFVLLERAEHATDPGRLLDVLGLPLHVDVVSPRDAYVHVIVGRRIP